MRGLINSPHPTPYIIFLYYFLIKLIIKTKDIIMANKKINVVIERGLTAPIQPSLLTTTANSVASEKGKALKKQRAIFWKPLTK